MTDEHADARMDARLRAAGDAWRSGATSAPDTQTVPPPPLLIATEQPAPPRRRHRTALLASAAVVAAALVAGGVLVLSPGSGRHAPAGDSAALTGPVWRLLGYGHHQQPNSTATFVVHGDGTFVADDTCTIYSGRLDRDGGRLHARHLATPRDRQCTDAVGEQTFREFWQWLPSSPTYRIDGNQLTVEHGGTAAHLAVSPLPAPSTDMPTIQGATWVLTSVQDATGAPVEPIPRATTFRLVDGELRASDGCNSIAGPATLDGLTLRATRLSVTAMACPDVRTANVVDLVLADGARLQPAGPQLTVTKPGAGTLTYQWQPDDKDATDPAQLVGRTWHLDRVAGVPAAGDARLEISGRRASGSDGCNDFGGSADVHTGWWTLTLGGTLAKCTGTVGDQSVTVSSLLEARNALWAVRDHKLLVYGGGAQGFALVFTTDPTSQPTGTPAPSITGRWWRLTQVETDSGNSGSGTAISPTADGVRVRFDANGYRAATPSCGAWSGTLRRTGTTLDIAPSSTKALTLCSDELANQLWAMLRGSVTWHVDAGRLLLKKGGTTLTFES